MATRTVQRTLPYGVGQLSLRWLTVVTILLAVLGLGVYGYTRQLVEGEIVTGLRDVGAMGGAPWGLYIAFELYAVGVGFGAMLLVGVIRIMGLTQLQPLARTLGVITIATLTIGYLAVLVDLGQPLRGIINIAQYARPMSPFFGTFTVGLITAMSATVVYLYLDARKDAATLAKRATGLRWLMNFVASGYSQTPEEESRHNLTSLLLAILLIAVGIAAVSTSGFVFSVDVARPGWNSALQAPEFVVLAAATATGVLVIVAAILRQVLSEGDRLNMAVFSWLNNIMLGMVFIYLYFLLAELITVGYTGLQHESRLNEALLHGRYAWLFWLTSGLFLVSFVIGGVQAFQKKYALNLIVLTAVLVNLAALGKRYLIAVPSLTHGNLLPYGTGSYTPTWIEYIVVLGLIAFGILLCTVFMKVFPILSVRDDS